MFINHISSRAPRTKTIYTACSCIYNAHTHIHCWQGSLSFLARTHLFNSPYLINNKHSSFEYSISHTRFDMFQSRFRFTQNSEKSQNWMGLTGIVVSCSNNYMFILLGLPVKKGSYCIQAQLVRQSSCTSQKLNSWRRRMECWEKTKCKVIVLFVSTLNRIVTLFRNKMCPIIFLYTGYLF